MIEMLLLMLCFSNLFLKCSCLKVVLLSLWIYATLLFAVLSCTRGQHIRIWGWSLSLDNLCTSGRQYFDCVDFISSEPLSKGFWTWLGHDRVSAILFTFSVNNRIFRFGCLNLISWFTGHFWLSHAFIFLHAVIESVSVNLLILRHVFATFRINIMSEHVLTVNISSDNWIYISHTICMKSRFSEISCKSRIREISCGSLVIASSWIRPYFLLGWLSSAFNIFFVNSHLSMMMIFFFIDLLCIWESLIRYNRELLNRHRID